MVLFGANSVNATTYKIYLIQLLTRKVDIYRLMLLPVLMVEKLAVQHST